MLQLSQIQKDKHQIQQKWFNICKRYIIRQNLIRNNTKQSQYHNGNHYQTFLYKLILIIKFIYQTNTSNIESMKLIKSLLYCSKYKKSTSKLSKLDILFFNSQNTPHNQNQNKSKEQFPNQNSEIKVNKYASQTLQIKYQDLFQHYNQNQVQNQLQTSIQKKFTNNQDSTFDTFSPKIDKQFFNFIAQYIPTSQISSQQQTTSFFNNLQQSMQHIESSQIIKTSKQSKPFQQPQLTKQQTLQQTLNNIKLQNNVQQPYQNISQNPFGQYNQQLFEQLATHNKRIISQNSENKTRTIKRKEKLQKIRADLKNPELRRQRNRQRHMKQKIKLQKNLQGLNEQQIRTYLDQRKKNKQQAKDKLKLYYEKQLGQPFLIDIAFQHKMNQKQNKSLTAQIDLIVQALKKIQNPPNIHLCGLKQGPVKEQLIKMKYQYWPVKSYEQSMPECLQLQKFKNKNVYYLSPDAPQTVDTIGENDIFIIGGLVDRTVIKNASFNRAAQLGIPARSLPIRPFMKQRTCLNLDHIVKIICKYNQVKDWKLAFEHGAPKRWKKQQGQPGLKIKNYQNDYQSSIEQNQREQSDQAEESKNQKDN